MQELVDRRLAFRREKNWAEADKLKEQLLAMGIVLKDSKDGTEFSIAV